MKLLHTIIISTLLSTSILSLCMDKDYTHGLFATKVLATYYSDANNTKTTKNNITLQMNTTCPNDDQKNLMNIFYHECRDHLDAWKEEKSDTQIKILYSMLQTKDKRKEHNAITMPMMCCFAYKYQKPLIDCFLDSFTETSIEPFHLTLFFEQLRKYDNHLLKKNLKTPSPEEFNTYRKNLSAQKAEEQKKQYAQSIGASFKKSPDLANISSEAAAERFRTLLMHIQEMLQSNDEDAQELAEYVYKRNCEMIVEMPQKQSEGSLHDDNFCTSM